MDKTIKELRADKQSMEQVIAEVLESFCVKYNVDDLGISTERQQVRTEFGLCVASCFDVKISVTL